MGAVERGVGNPLEVLRWLDNEVDFARGFLQLSIILELGRSDKGLTIRELALRLRERSKAVSDALRKLTLKGMVMKLRNGTDYETYALTDKGAKFYEELNKIVGGAGHAVKGAPKALDIQEFSAELVKKDHIVDAIIAVATSKRGALALREIAVAMGLSPQRAQSYLELYCGREAPIRLFKRIEPEITHLKFSTRRGLATLWPWGRRKEALYTLTEEGATIFRRTLFNTKYGGTAAAKLFKRLFGSLHPRLVARKLFRALAALNLSAAALSLYLSWFLPIAALTLLLSVLLASTALLVMYIMTYNL